MTTRLLYTTSAIVTGGRAKGHGVAGDGRLDVELRLPTEMGGSGEGTNPEQLFAIGFAACFEGALNVVGQREGVRLGALSIESVVGLLDVGSDAWNVAVELRVTLPDVSDPEELRDWWRPRTRSALTRMQPAGTSS